jgi:hypothetical protein
LRLAVGIRREKQDRDRTGDRVGRADPRLDRLPSSALERGEDEKAGEREARRTEHREHPLADLEMLVSADEQTIDEEGESDSRRRELRQSDA